MFGGSLDLAILPGPMALQRAKQWAKRFGRSGYAIAGVCGLGVILFAVPRRFCLIAALASWAFCFGHPALSGGASSWHRHCSTRERCLEISLPPCFPSGSQGSMTGGRSHNIGHGGDHTGRHGWQVWCGLCR
ncbi:MAG: hypothetical protein GDA36_06075 [Rhodobacteraceae bacterium]|nr:hypothetical protein [Paracoccaceae bacterium]